MLKHTLQLYKTSFTGLSRQTWLLSLVMLINRSGTMVVPFMTLYLTGKGMHRTLSEAGTVMGLFGLGAIIGAWIGGRLSDKIGFHKIQLATLFMGGIMFIVLGQIKSYELICIATFVLSLVNEAFRPANSSAVAFYSKPENRTRSYSLNRLAINLGWAVGASLGGLIASYNYELLFWIDGGTNLGAALLLFYYLTPSGNSEKSVKGLSEEIEMNVSQKNESSALLSNPARSAYQDKIYLGFIFLVSLFAFCFFQLFTTVPKYFRDNLHLTERFIGFTMALNGLVIVGTEMILVYSLEGKKNNLVYIIFGMLICAAAYLSLLIPGSARLIVILMILLISAGEICSMPFMNSFWTLRSNEGNRGQYAALYTIAWGTAQTLGPYLCAHLVDATNFKVLFAFMGGLLMLTAFGFYRLNRLEGG